MLEAGIGVCSQLGNLVCCLCRPLGPMVTVRRVSDEDGGWDGWRKSVEGGENSEEGDEGLEMKSEREGPALRESEKLVCGRRPD